MGSNGVRPSDQVGVVNRCQRILCWADTVDRTMGWIKPIHQNQNYEWISKERMNQFPSVYFLCLRHYENLRHYLQNEDHALPDRPQRFGVSDPYWINTSLCERLPISVIYTTSNWLAQPGGIQTYEWRRQDFRDVYCESPTVARKLEPWSSNLGVAVGAAISTITYVLPRSSAVSLTGKSWLTVYRPITVSWCRIVKIEWLTSPVTPELYC